MLNLNRSLDLLEKYLQTRIQLGTTFANLNKNTELLDKCYFSYVKLNETVNIFSHLSKNHTLENETKNFKLKITCIQ